MRSVRSNSLAEVVAAIALAGVLIATATTEIARQHRELSATTRATRARVRLLSTYERLRVGMLDAPTPGETRELADGLRLVGRASHPAAPELRVVEIVVAWTTDTTGREQQRTLTALIPRGGR